MKKGLFYLFIILSFLSINTKAQNSEHVLIFDNLNTINYKERLKNMDLSIKMICNYDYCDYIRGNSIEESMDLFVKRYLKTIKDDEIINTIKVKGLKITKIIAEK